MTLNHIPKDRQNLYCSIMKSSSSSPDPRQPPSLDQITTFLKGKDDTSRFVGLALLKSVLDNSHHLRSNNTAITQLWESISPRFLDRLLKSGGKKGVEGRTMLDLAVSVIHTFVVLLPYEQKFDARLIGRTDKLVEALVPSTGETTTLILQTLLTVVSLPPGALAFDGISDLSPLIELAPSNPMALDILLYAWLTLTPTKLSSSSVFAKNISTTITSLTRSFKHTDAVTLLNFLAHLLRNLDVRILSLLTPDIDLGEKPPWLDDVVAFIHKLVISRPTPTARSAYTILAASLLQANPSYVKLLFMPGQLTRKSGEDDEKPASYLLLSLVLIDIRSTIPTLLTNLNSPSYPLDALRISSALDLIPAWISFILLTPTPSTIDPASEATTLPLPPDLLLRLRTSITDTLSLALEYIRDRWDATISGVPGLHPSSRSEAAELPSGEKRMTLTWDSTHTAAASTDPVLLSAIQALAAWVCEDDNTPLRKELRGVADVLVDLYAESCSNTNNPALDRQAGAAGREEEPSTRHQPHDEEAPVPVDTTTSTASQSASREIHKPQTPDFCPAILAALNIFTHDGETLEPDRKGLTILSDLQTFNIISQDLLSTLTHYPAHPTQPFPLSRFHRAAQAASFLRNLVQMHTEAGFQVQEEWLNFATGLAAWTGPTQEEYLLTSLRESASRNNGDDDDGDVGGEKSDIIALLLFSVVIECLHLCADMLECAPPGVRRRYYIHTLTAICGVGSWVLKQVAQVGNEDGGEWNVICVDGKDAVRRLEQLRN